MNEWKKYTDIEQELETPMMIVFQTLCISYAHNMVMIF
jgi:hypothetical protein